MGTSSPVRGPLKLPISCRLLLFSSSSKKLIYSFTFCLAAPELDPAFFHPPVSIFLCCVLCLGRLPFSLSFTLLLSRYGPLSKYGLSPLQSQPPALVLVCFEFFFSSRLTSSRLLSWGPKSLRRSIPNRSGCFCVVNRLQ